MQGPSKAVLTREKIRAGPGTRCPGHLPHGRHPNLLKSCQKLKPESDRASGSSSEFRARVWPPKDRGLGTRRRGPRENLTGDWRPSREERL